MGWIQSEAMGFFCPRFTDELIGREPFKGFESPGKVTGGDELVQVQPEVVVNFVIKAFHGGILQCSVHALDLAIGLGCFGLVSRWSTSFKAQAYSKLGL